LQYRLTDPAPPPAPQGTRIPRDFEFATRGGTAAAAATVIAKCAKNKDN
jgi:hypothetical protein